MTEPNFLIIGAMKSGTSSLYHYLNQHPEIFMSAKKEPQYLAFMEQELDFRGPGDDESMRYIVTRREDYDALFRDAASFAVRGEASTAYLYVPRFSQNLAQTFPNARLIAVLRDPVDRAFSNFLHMRRDGREPLADFASALDAERERISQGWAHHFHYRAMGYYAGQLRRILDVVPRDRVQIYLYDDLIRDPARLLKDLCQFLGVDDTFRFDTRARYNVSGIPRVPWLDRTLRERYPRARRMVPAFLRLNFRDWLLTRLRTRPTISPEIAQALRLGYREDVHAVQELIERDLSHWLPPRTRGAS